MLQIQRLSQELPICGNIPFFVNLCSSLWIVSLLLVFGFEMTHSQLFLFSFKNHKSCECFAGFNVNVWGQDFFSFVSLQKSCIWPQESPKGFNYTPCNVENIWTSWPWMTLSSRRKSYRVPLDCKVFPDLEACIKLAWITSVPGNRNYWLLLSVLTAVHTRQPAATLTAPAAFHKNM